jgi:hypothetical protein
MSMHATRMHACQEEGARSAAATRSERIDAALCLISSEAGIRLSLARCFDQNIGLDLRRAQARRAMKAAIRHCAVLSWECDTTCRIKVLHAQHVDTWRGEAVRGLAAVAERPLTPMLLLAALPITNRERLRWTKDRRLRQEGAATIRRGQNIAVPLYSVDFVETMLADLTIIESWRLSDNT